MAENKAKDERVREIIDAMIDEILENGYEGATMNSIAKRAGLSKGGVYHHFGNKFEILLAANEVIFMPIMSLAESCMKEDNPVRTLSDFIEGYFEYWNSNGKGIAFTFLTMSKLVMNSDDSGYFDGYIEEYGEFFSKIYEKGIENGIFRNINADDYAYSLIAVMDYSCGVMAASKKYGHEYFKEKIKRQFIYDVMKNGGQN